MSELLNSNGSFTYTAAAGFWGQDFFQYRAVKGENQSMLGTVYVAVDRLTIEFGAQSSQGTQWQDLDVVTPTVWVGQLVRLRVSPKGLVPSVPIASRQWTIDANAVANYQVINDGEEAILFPFGTAESQAEFARFYWVDGGLKHVTVEVNLAGNNVPVQKDGSINVRRPSIDVWTTTRDVNKFPSGGRTRVQFGNTLEDAAIFKRPGIEFHRTDDDAALATGT